MLLMRVRARAQARARRARARARARARGGGGGGGREGGRRQEKERQREGEDKDTGKRRQCQGSRFRALGGGGRPVPLGLKSGPRAARGPGRSPRRTKALALRGERPSRRPRPKLLQIRAGPFGRSPKRHPRGRNTRWCEKHENLVKTMGFYEKPRPQNTRSTPLNPHRRASSALAFHMGRAPGRNHVFQGLGGVPEAQNQASIMSISSPGPRAQGNKKR